jgi:hypothetical protein
MGKVSGCRARADAVVVLAVTRWWWWRRVGVGSGCRLPWRASAPPVHPPRLSHARALFLRPQRCALREPPRAVAGGGRGPPGCVAVNVVVVIRRAPARELLYPAATACSKHQRAAVRARGREGAGARSNVLRAHPHLAASPSSASLPHFALQPADKAAKPATGTVRGDDPAGGATGAARAAGRWAGTGRPLHAAYRCTPLPLSLARLTTVPPPSSRLLSRNPLPQAAVVAALSPARVQPPAVRGRWCCVARRLLRRLRLRQQVACSQARCPSLPPLPQMLPPPSPSTPPLPSLPPPAGGARSRGGGRRGAQEGGAPSSWRRRSARRCPPRPRMATTTTR